MTDEEDAENERMNEIIRQCRHDPVRVHADGKEFRCSLCGCRFCVLMLPRKLRPTPIHWGDDDS